MQAREVAAPNVEREPSPEQTVQIIPFDSRANAEDAVNISAWAQPAIDPQLCSNVPLALAQNLSWQVPMQARECAAPGVERGPSPEQEQKHRTGDLAPSATNIMKIATIAPAPDSPPFLTTGGSTELGMCDTKVEVDGTGLVAYPQAPSFLPQNGSPPSTPTTTDLGTSAQFSPKEKNRQTKERKRSYMSKKKEGLKTLRRMLKVETATEEVVFMEGKFRSSHFSCVSEVPTSVFASV
jgi:hypothetical protein